MASEDLPFLIKIQFIGGRKIIKILKKYFLSQLKIKTKMIRKKETERDKAKDNNKKVKNLKHLDITKILNFRISSLAITAKSQVFLYLTMSTI